MAEDKIFINDFRHNPEMDTQLVKTFQKAYKLPLLKAGYSPEQTTTPDEARYLAKCLVVDAGNGFLLDLALIDLDGQLQNRKVTIACQYPEDVLARIKENCQGWLKFEKTAATLEAERLEREKAEAELAKKYALGATFIFGNYPQDANGTVKPIEWQVLAREGNQVVLISKYALDSQRFDAHSNNWESSELKRWLEGTFRNAAFSAAEQQHIRKLTLLSKEEAERYFNGNDARCCKPTAYAIKNGAWTNSNNDQYNGNCYWWLRSPYADCSNGAWVVVDDGVLSIDGVGIDDIAVRPALWLDISNL